MNILLTSVGRRAYMVKYFQEALQGDGTVHVCNSEKSIAFHYADRSVISPLIYSDEYVPFLLKYCQENQIDALISLFDIDLLILSRNKDKFEEIGTKIIVSKKEVIEICNDKWKTYQFLKKHKFHVPKTYNSIQSVRQAIQNHELNFPVIVKPRFGCGSISVTTAFDEEDLIYLTKRGNREINNSYLKYESQVTEQKLIFQEALLGQEYGADIINDLNGKNRSVIIRKKIAMRAGETDIAQIVEDARIEKELCRLGELSEHIANMDCDVFLVNGIPYILELNARFGGGYPFSHIAGCNLPQAIVKWCKGEDVSKTILEAKPGTRAYKELVILTTNSNHE